MGILSVIRHKLLVYTSSSLLPILRYQRRLTNNHDLVILCYHRVREKTGIFYDENISVSSSEFKQQMQYIARHFNVITIDQLTEYSKGHYKLKPNSIMITFDDGYKDNAVNAFPVLEELNMPATVFLTTGCIDSDAIPWEDRVSYLFNKISTEEVQTQSGQVYSIASQEQKKKAIWHFCKKLKFLTQNKRNKIIEELFNRYQINEDEMHQTAYEIQMGFVTTGDIRYWHERGINFSCHTDTHPCLTTLTEEEMYVEISESKRMLEDILGEPVHTFAYPYGREGDFNEVTRSALEKAGVSIGMIFEPGINRPDNDFLALHRIGIAESIDFRLASHGLYSLL